jgi:hypothetical protein
MAIQLKVFAIEDDALRIGTTVRSALLVAAIVAVLAACEPEPAVVIDAPKSAVVGNSVTFRWHLSPAAQSDQYRFTILLDKGVNPCDAGIEESFDAGSSTCRTISLDRNRFHRGAKAEWAIGASAPGRKWQCVRGGTFTVDPAVPPPPRCGDGS